MNTNTTADTPTDSAPAGWKRNKAGRLYRRRFVSGRFFTEYADGRIFRRFRRYSDYRAHQDAIIYAE